MVSGVPAWVSILALNAELNGQNHLQDDELQRLFNAINNGNETVTRDQIESHIKFCGEVYNGIMQKRKDAFQVVADDPKSTENDTKTAFQLFMTAADQAFGCQVALKSIGDDWDLDDLWNFNADSITKTQLTGWLKTVNTMPEGQ